MAKLLIRISTKQKIQPTKLSKAYYDTTVTSLVGIDVEKSVW
jgi:hypothetical protein